MCSPSLKICWMELLLSVRSVLLTALLRHLEKTYLRKRKLTDQEIIYNKSKCSQCSHFFVVAAIIRLGVGKQNPSNFPNTIQSPPNQKVTFNLVYLHETNIFSCLLLTPPLLKWWMFEAEVQIPQPTLITPVWFQKKGNGLQYPEVH